MADNWRRLLACPACNDALDFGLRCTGCSMAFAAQDGIPMLRMPGNARTEVVREFYSEAPFPGYPPHSDHAWLRMRAGRSRFARLLDEAIPPGARVVEIGCGTGQMSLFLARSDRLVIGADLTRASLLLAADAAYRFGTGGVHFIETDLSQPGLRRGSFDVVYSSGVLHHMPDPRRSLAPLVRLARPGGMIVLGLYNAFARTPLRLRRGVAKLTAYRWIPGDPVLTDRAAEPERKAAWLRDQYRHPEEHRHTLAEVRGWFAEQGVDYVRSFPSALLAEESDDLFSPEPGGWRVEEWLAQLGWMRSLGAEGGLFVIVGRRRL